MRLTKDNDTGAWMILDEFDNVRGTFGNCYAACVAILAKHIGTDMDDPKIIASILKSVAGKLTKIGTGKEPKERGIPNASVEKAKPGDLA